MDTIPQNIPQKQCSKCKKEMPATAQFFMRDKSKKDGWHSSCKACYRDYKSRPEVQERSQISNKKHWQAIKDDPEKLERQREYNRNLAQREDVRARKLAYMHEYSRRPERHARYTEYNRARIADPEHQERQRIYMQTYQKLPKSRMRQQAYRDRPSVRIHRQHYGRMYYIKNRKSIIEKKRVYTRRPDIAERTRINSANYYRKNRENILALNQIYRRLPKSRLIKQAAEARRRARKKAIQGTYSAQQIQEQLKRQKYRCYYAACGHAKFEKRDGKYIYHVDHTFPLSRVAGTDIPANDIGYIVLACPSCNMSKNDKFPWEWPEGGRLL